MDLNKLPFIADKINKRGIKWAVGASVMLYFYDLVETPHDLDILVDENDAVNLCNLLKELGVLQYKEYTEPFGTKYFYNFVVRDIQIDVIGGFIIKHTSGKYKLAFDSDTITSYKVINGIEIPVSSLEDWYVIYQLIPNRENRVEVIEKYLIQNGIKNPNLLNRALKKELPDSVKERVKKLLV